MPCEVSVLIVNWNTRELLRACLHSLQTHMVGLQHEIIVVDNASPDGSAALVATQFPHVKLLALDANAGFAAGNNLAYGLSSGDKIWLLNPDTEVLPGAPAHLIQFLDQHPRVGAVASALQDARDGSTQRSCRTFPSPAALWTEASGLAAAFSRSKRFGFYKMGWWNYREARAVAQPMASSLMVRRNTVEAVGGLFDEQFPIFFNDVDLCQRIWDAGQEIWFTPEARVLHWGGAATGQRKVAMIEESHRSLRAYYKKHYRGKLHPVLYHATLLMMSAAGRFRVWRAASRSGA